MDLVLIHYAGEKARVQGQAFYFSDGPYLQMLQGLHAALETPEAFITLIGPARTGKTSLCEKLALFMQHRDHRVVFFNYAIESPEMLRSMLSRELDLPESANFSRLLEGELGATTEKPVIVIFDDAHLLTNITLLEIYRLAEIQFGTRRMINILLCGEPALEKKLLTKEEFKTLLLNVSHKFHLDPMDNETQSRFLISYFEHVGMQDMRLDPGAMTYLYKICKGFPGPLDEICRILFESKATETEFVPIDKAELIRLLKQAHSIQPLPYFNDQESNQWKLIAPAAAVLIVASLAVLYQQLDSSNIEPDLPIVGSVTLEQEVFNAEDSNQQLVREPDIASAEVEETNTTVINIAADDTNEQADSTEILPVTDSNLALVSVTERGITDEEIVDPLFENIALAVASNENESQPVDEASEPELAEIQEVVAEAVGDGQITDAPVVSQEPTDQEIVDQEIIEPVLIVENTVENIAASELPTESVEEPDGSVNQELTSQASEAEEFEIAAVATAPLSEEVAVAESVALDDGISESLEDSVGLWIDAWQSQDMEKYFLSYHEEFVPRYHDSLGEWRASRERVISNASSIRISMSEFEIINQNDETAEVQFWLSYQSPGYSDETLKKLMLGKLDARWQVLEEINLRVRN